MVRAYRSLPERWAAVLWYTEVEGQPATRRVLNWRSGVLLLGVRFDVEAFVVSADGYGEVVQESL